MDFSVTFWKFQALGIPSSIWIYNELSNDIQSFFMTNIFLCESLISIVNWPIFQCGNANFSACGNDDFFACEKKSILTPGGKKGGQNLNSDSADVLSFVKYCTMLNFKSIGFVLLGYLCLVGGGRKEEEEGIGRFNSKPSLQLNWGWSWARLTNINTWIK